MAAGRAHAGAGGSGGVGARVLTLFLTRDASTFDSANYERVRRQLGVEQDVYVVSASPVRAENNIVVPVPKSVPLPIRIGVTINESLKLFDLSRYTHIFKVDGDIRLPLDYLSNLLSKGAHVAGRGAALLISVEFFLKHMGGRYPVSYCDDGYITALSIAYGVWPPEYDGGGRVSFPVLFQASREYAYGREHYKWGLPLPLFLVLSTLQLAARQRNLRGVVSRTAGYLSAALSGEGRYPWWREYMRQRVRHFAARLLGAAAAGGG